MVSSRVRVFVVRVGSAVSGMDSALFCSRFIRVGVLVFGCAATACRMCSSS